MNAAVNLLVEALYAAYLAGEGPTFDPEAIVDTLLGDLGTGQQN